MRIRILDTSGCLTNKAISSRARKILNRTEQQIFSTAQNYYWGWRQILDEQYLTYLSQNIIHDNFTMHSDL
jgi:hypothetical protein